MRWIRGFLLWPALLVVLVVLPSITFASPGFGLQSPRARAAADSPLPTPTKGGTVPPPTATPTRRPYPTATPTRRHIRSTPTLTRLATTTPTPLFSELVLVDGAPLRNVIGDRLSSTLYGYTFAGWLYRSSDDGATWQLMTTQPAVNDFILNPGQPDLLYSGVGARCTGLPAPAQPMLRSLDGGVNWSRVMSGDNLRPLLALAADSAVVLASGCDAPYVTTDGGATWTAKPDHSPESLWQTYRVVEMVSSAQFAAGATAPGQIIAGGLAEDGSGVVVFTNDLGDNWVRLTPNVYPALWGMNALAVDLYSEGLVAFAEPHSVWQTTNFGVNWQILSSGLETVAQRQLAGGVFGLYDLSYHPSNRLYLATVRGLYTKEFSAQVWSKITGASFDDVTIMGLLYTETNPGLLWLNTVDGVYQVWLPQ